MLLFTFDRSAGHHVDRFGSDFTLSPLTDPQGVARAVCMYLGPGGVVGRHETRLGQLFCVIEGEGWVSGDDGEAVAISRGQAAYWAKGEVHGAGTETGLSPPLTASRSRPAPGLRCWRCAPRPQPARPGDRDRPPTSSPGRP